MRGLGVHVRLGQRRFMPPGNTAPPVISGTTTEGQTLSTTNGTWNFSPNSFAYQWRRGGAAIPGATAQTYLLVAADVGTVITVTVTAKNDGGTSAATSAGTATIAANFTPVSLFPASGAFYDISDITSMRQGTTAATAAAAVNSPVGYIEDKSGNANHLVAIGVAATYPTLRQVGAHYYLEFDGVDDLMQKTFASIAQPLDRLCALQQDTWAANRYIFDGGAVDQMLLRQNGVTPQLAIFAGLAAGTNGAGTLAAAHVVEERYNGLNSSLRVAATTVTGDAGANANTGITVGGRAGGAPYCPIKIFGGIIHRGGTLTAQQLTDTRAWLAARKP